MKTGKHKNADKVVMLIAAIILLPVGYIVWPKQHDSGSDIQAAQIICQNYVRESLHDADSAQFDNYLNYAVAKPKGGYQVRVTGRFKNGFNATRKGMIDCFLTDGGIPTKIIQVN